MAAPQCSLNKDCSKFFQSVLPMKLHHLEDIAAHIASGNCSHPPLLKDFIFDQNPVEGSTPLILACQQGELDSVKHIVESWGVDVRALAKFYVDPYHPSHPSSPQKTPSVVTPLFAAASHGYDNIVRYLLKKGADVSAKTSLDEHNGLTPLYGAVIQHRPFSSKSLFEQQKDRSVVVRSLLEFGADLIADSFRPSDGQPMWKERMCEVDAITVLIDHGLDLKRRNPKTGETLLHHWVDFPSFFFFYDSRPRCFIEEDSLSIVKLLVEKSADLLARNHEGFTALLKAANKFVNFKVLDYLLDRDEYDRTEKMIALELAGASILFDSRNALLFPKAFEYWRRAHHLRQKEIEVSGSSSEKILSRKIGNIVEWTTLADIDRLENHPKDYRIQALLVKLRILPGSLEKSHHHNLSTWYIKYLSESTSLDEEEKLIQILGIRWEILEVATRHLNPPSSGIFVSIAKDVDDLVSALSILKEKHPALLTFERIKTSLDLVLQATDSSPFTITNGERRTNDNSILHSEGLRFTRLLLTLLEMFFHLPKIPTVQETTSLTQTLRLLGPLRLGKLLLQACIKLGSFETLAFVRVLLEAGADPVYVAVDERELHGNTCLHFVAGMRDRKLGDAAGFLLVEYGAKFHQVNEDGKTALDIWIELNEMEDKGNKEDGGWSARPESCCPLPTLLRLAARVIRVHKIPYADGNTPAVLHSLIELR